MTVCGIITEGYSYDDDSLPIPSLTKEQLLKRHQDKYPIGSTVKYKDKEYTVTQNLFYSKAIGYEPSLFIERMDENGEKEKAWFANGFNNIMIIP